MKKLSLSMATLISASLAASVASADSAPGSVTGIKARSDVKGFCYINWNDDSLLRRKGYVRALANNGMRSSDGRFFIYLAEDSEDAALMTRNVCEDIERSEKQFYQYSGYRDANGMPWADPKINFVPKE